MSSHHGRHRKFNTKHFAFYLASFLTFISTANSSPNSFRRPSSLSHRNPTASLSTVILALPNARQFRPQQSQAEEVAYRVASLEVSELPQYPFLVLVPGHCRGPALPCLRQVDNINQL
jgi:hypothetical protein